MTQLETVRRDARSYRQGLVLGLTMAELFLLLVFALLIALTALWNAEHVRRVAAEMKVGIPVEISATERKLQEELKNTLRTAKPERVSEALTALRDGRPLLANSVDEQRFVEDIRRRQNGKPQAAISDDWRRLTEITQSFETFVERAAYAEALQKAYPQLNDMRRVADLIDQGLRAEKQGEHDWPPIINLSEAQNHFFEIGKAELSPDFEKHLRAVIGPQLQQLAQRFRTGTIEVIGHTDEQGISQRYSNLDASLLDIVRGKANISSLTPADNAGLGLARAVAVARILTQDSRLAAYTILPLSAGQLITTSDQLTQGGGAADKERRRIEIRLRRSNPPKFVPGQAPENAIRN